VIEVLSPQRIVPGHGDVSDLATARAQTRAYLEALRVHMKRAIDDGTDVSDAIKSLRRQALQRADGRQCEPHLP
jgi:hypothetical protein